MNAIEFWARVGPNRTLEVPAEVADQLGENQDVRVLLLLPDDDEDRAWRRLASEQLWRQYADEDNVYDEIDLVSR